MSAFPAFPTPGVRLNVIEGFGHAPPQRVCVRQLAKRQGELLGAFNAPVVGHPADRQRQHVITQLLRAAFDRYFPSIEIDRADDALNEMDALFQ